MDARLGISVACALACLLTNGAAAETRDVDPAEIVSIAGEELKLAPEKPEAWHSGTKLLHLQTIAPGAGTPAPGAILPESVVVRHGQTVLKIGEDYLLEPTWGSVGIGPKASVTTQDAVSADYKFSLLRLDSIVRTADGKETVRKGKSHLSAPEPPALQPGEKRIANVFIPYHSDGKGCEVYPVIETAEQAITGTTPGRIPKTLAKIHAGEPVKIVCWGDSVTCGGDTSSVETRYTSVFARRLKERFPSAKIEVVVVAVGGSSSHQWLYPDALKVPKEWREMCDWQKVMNEKPDLVTIEFVNDAWLTPEQVESTYSDVKERLKPFGSELILITPHFTMPSWMGFADLRQPENRKYVLGVRDFAQKRGIALADASARWEHLWKEGIPYITLLQNGINHPDDRGHALFADELMKCFAE
ncbi:MAG TPA: GDSL-type esterase/lipase family protein [Candidatus Brocadiia bacterium]|nr:GDSL-type esterase/lipase family protein [Candidatus Brocadiia bacterium]